MEITKLILNLYGNAKGPTVAKTLIRKSEVDILPDFKTLHQSTGMDDKISK